MKPAALATVGTSLLIVLALLTGANGQTTPKPAAPPSPANAAKEQFFEAKVRPLLAEKCMPCHNASIQQGGVRLDQRALALKTVVPGKPAQSSLITVVHFTGKIKMPPTGKLAPDEIATLEKWVADGAVWPNTSSAPRAPGKGTEGQLWSFRPVRRPLEPPVDKRGIDAFIQAKLEVAGLKMAPKADRATLLRRLSFDLTGLPPTPAEVEAFRQDKRPDAYARQVDRLLASPRYGERWGRHWLDVARYADSNGLDENLAHGNAYLYRDWVIDAHNRDLPYNEFIQEQIAGDLMPTDDEEERNRRLTATGYLTLGAKVLAEQDKPKLVMDIVDEQIEVVSKSVLGITIACARCHDHKFDPISTKDYYALAGIFKSTKTMANLGFVSMWNERQLPTKARQEEIEKYQKDVLQPLAGKLSAITEKAKANVAERLKAEAPKYVQVALSYAKQPGALVPLEGREIPGKQVIEAEDFVRGTAIKNTETYGKGIGVIHTGASPTNAEWDITVATAGAYQLDLRYAGEESRPVKVVVNGKTVSEEAAAAETGSWNPEGQQWETFGTIDLNAGKNVLRIERDGAIPHFDKLALAPMPPLPPNAPKPKSLRELAKDNGLNTGILQRVAAKVAGEKEEAEAVKKVKASDAFGQPDKPETLYSKEDGDAVKAATEELKQAQEKGPKIPSAMAVAEMDKPENVRVHIRGDTQNLGDIVNRGFPKSLCSPGRDHVTEKVSSGRLELARWLTSPNQPLTARVAVNRVWLHLFGEGLVSTPDNWGLRGEKPSHPELLDYLASTFKYEDGWHLKKLIRRIVLTDAYQQVSTVENPLAHKSDPGNRLLWRQNLRRLEVEPLRDSLLFVAGTLDTKMGGTLLSTKDGDYVTNDQSGNGAQYSAPRRSIYLPVIRNAVFDFFSTFDFGDPSMVNAKRSATTVAPQALYLLNSPLVQDQARAFARRTLATKQPDDTQRIRFAIANAFTRPASPEEIIRARTFLASCDTIYAPKESDAAKRRELCWTAYCQTLLASNEFIYVR